MASGEYNLERFAGGRLTIDLYAIADNWRKLNEMTPHSECAGVVKADAYGLGVDPVAKTLWRAGCRTFFVALPQEGVQLRTLLPEAIIYILNGFFPSAYEIYKAYDLRPVINTELQAWIQTNQKDGQKLPYALHLDTGMNRLGITPQEYQNMLSHSNILPNILHNHPPALLMSHLACADTPHHPLNAHQLAQFNSIRGTCPFIPASLANSAGIFLGTDYHYDVTRPGIALYGGAPAQTHIPNNPMKPVVKLEARILQLKAVKVGETVGYGAAETILPPPTCDQRYIATISVGYADGFLHASSSRDHAPGASAAWRGCKLPFIGRVSMDLITIDMTTHPDIEDIVNSSWQDTWVELIGPTITIGDAAERSGTIGYEILTSLGQRYQRIYKN